MFTAPLPPGRVEVLERLAGLPGLKSFYLAGGTAVALHLGHRISEDFDFFTPVEFDAATLRDELHVAGNFILTDIKRNTLHGIFDEVKVSFLFYAHRLVFQTHLFSGFPIADLHDLAPMKLDAVGSRGRTIRGSGQAALKVLSLLLNLFGQFPVKLPNICQFTITRVYL